MNLRLVFTIAVSKIIVKICRIIKRGGTTLPGKVASKIYPNIIKVIAKDFNTIMVTGTNGKTTTTRIIGQILKENGVDYITNKSGANLVSGVITTFIDSVNLLGKCRVSTALIEIDEAAFHVMSSYLVPDILVVTNFFRDQLDRYGELYTTLNGVRSGIEKSKKTKLILNADDSLCASLGRNTDKDVIYFGLSSDAYRGIEETLNSDAMFCIYCKSKYEYSNRVYGHLGEFQCPGCGYRRPAAHITCVKIKELTSSYSKITFAVSGLKGSSLQENTLRHTEPSQNGEYSGGPSEDSANMSAVSYYDAKINLPGLYNIYNSLAALAFGSLMGFPVENSIKALQNFECGFGRMETINAAGRNIKVILVKNPTGFNQVLNYLLTEDKNMQLAFLINDRLADGTDISWLWDVDFEKLQEVQDRIDNIYTSGIRAEDMAVRLKYSGIFTDKISIIKDYDALINTGLSRTKEGHSFYILPTYTAMLDIREVLKDKFGLKEFWK